VIATNADWDDLWLLADTCALQDGKEQKQQQGDTTLLSVGTVMPEAKVQSAASSLKCIAKIAGSSRRGVFRVINYHLERKLFKVIV
jgi:hypothetical protein